MEDKLNSISIGDILTVITWIGGVSVALTLINRLYKAWLEYLRRPNKNAIEGIKNDMGEIKGLVQMALLAIEINKEATATILRDSIEGEYNYFINDGKITSKQRNDLIKRIKSYDALDFNHIDPDAMIEDLKKLPLTCGK